jgi:hypothetical protein
MNDFISHVILNCVCIGYGAGGRLGIGGTDSVMVPTLLESIQHVFIKKVIIEYPQYFYDTEIPLLIVRELRFPLIWSSDSVSQILLLH